MIRIATARSYASALLNIQTGQVRVDKALQEVGTTKKGDDLKAFAARAETLIASRNIEVRTQTHIDNNQALKARLGIQDQALGRVVAGANAAVAAVTKALANNDGGAVMAELQAAMSQAISGLNTAYSGGYLFSGGAVDTPPVSLTQIQDLGVETIPPAVPPPRPDPFANGKLAVQSRLDDTNVVTTGVLADDLAAPLFDALGDLAEFPDKSFGAPMTAEQHDFLSGLLSKLTGAAAHAVDAQAKNGAIQAQVEQTVKALTDRKDMVASLIGDIVDADPIEAASRLSMAQTALQASAEAFNALHQSSLLNFLKR